ncbi:MAG TPA: DUF309 domain-containing protein [Pirellulales bacterium]|jgi:hypothetical protein|nr:DUF309 domain-containing protein [Pirellulales bacterium]
MSTSDDHHPLYLKGIELFNQCEFFEAHEAWEELWADNFGPSRKFLQGLIQAAVALHHFGNGNLRGARKVAFGSLGYLEPFRPMHQGLDLDKFTTEMRNCFGPLLESQEEYPKVDLVPDLIPEIHLQ